MSDRIYALPGAQFLTLSEGGPTGAVGTVGYRIEDSDGNLLVARTTAGIVEVEAGSGTYRAKPTAPASAGTYLVEWDTGTVTPQTFSTDVLVVNATGGPPPAPSTARDRLASMTAATIDPLLSTDELDQLLAVAARADADGRSPTDPAWSPTYDLNSAAAEGWRWKAGKVSALYSYDTEDAQRFFREQMYANCLSQAKEYARRVLSVVNVKGDLQPWEEVPLV